MYAGSATQGICAPRPYCPPRCAPMRPRLGFDSSSQPNPTYLMNTAFANPFAGNNTNCSIKFHHQPRFSAPKVEFHMHKTPLFIQFLVDLVRKPSPPASLHMLLAAHSPLRI